jgi:hypothetical protein
MTDFIKTSITYYILMKSEFLDSWNSAIVYITLNYGYDKLMRKYKEINSLPSKPTKTQTGRIVFNIPLPK